MTNIDFMCLGLYFFIVAFIGYKSSRKSLENTSSYFLGGKNIGWMAVGASLFASNISAEHFIGLAGTGSASGLAVGQFEWLACFILLLLGWVFVPFYMKTGVFTMPEFLEKRYNTQCRTYLSIISLIAYVFTKVSVAVYAGALVLTTILHWNIWVSAIVLILVTGIYTIVGGLRAVVYTDFFQAFVLIAGAILLTVIAILKVGGLGVLTTELQPEFFNLWKSMSDADFPWTGILFGAPILAVWYWCTDQMIVQRTLATKNQDDARKATILAGFLKILPVFILVLPGLAGRILYPNVAPDQMYATMVNELLPVGIKGIVIAALLAALMSSLSSVFNSSSTLIVMDFYKKYNPDATEKELVYCGQFATLLLVVSGLLWIPFIGVMSNQLFIYLQSVQAYIAPPIAAVFLLGILWKQVNGRGALATLLFGFFAGASRFLAELAVKSGWNTGTLIKFYAEINFLHFAILLFVSSIIILTFVSLMTFEPKQEEILETIFKKSTRQRISQASVFGSILLVVIVLVLWLIFSPVFFN